MKASRFLIFLILAIATSYSQPDGSWKNFKVTSDSLPAVNVKVVNLVTEQTAVSNASGEFRMRVGEGDLLVFPAEKYEYKRLLIEKDMLGRNTITVNLVERAVQLDEVTINRDIDGEEMGFVPKGQKRYTPAERKVYSATSGPVDIIVNGLTGRTKMLKKNAAVEKRERLMEKLEGQFDDEFYTSRLRIPSEYLKGFRFYLIDDKDVAAALESKNKPILMERVSQLAPSYLELIAPELEKAEKKK